MISRMKKLILGILIICATENSFAQFSYKFQNDDVPVVGHQLGIVTTGHSSGIYNQDDYNFLTLHPQLMNFNYSTGVEHLQWITPFFGIGQQVLLWNGGAKYTGSLDTTENSPQLLATTKSQYIKIPFLFWFKTYSIYHPDRRLRVNTFFGPYASLLTSAKEKWRWTTPNTSPEVFYEYTLDNSGIKGMDKDSNFFYNSGIDEFPMNKIFDWGFTMGGGVEMRLWRKTVISLTLRGDLGLREIENKKFTINSDPNNVKYQFYEDVIAKYFPFTSSLGESYIQNRPESRNFSFGLQLSIKKYFGVD